MKKWFVSYYIMLLLFLLFFVFNIINIKNRIALSLLWITGVFIFIHVWMGINKQIEEYKKILSLKYFILIMIILSLLNSYISYIEDNVSIFINPESIFIILAFILLFIFYAKYKHFLLYIKAFKFYKIKNIFRAYKYLKKLEDNMDDNFYFKLLIGEICVNLKYNLEGLEHLKKALKLIESFVSEDELNFYYARVYKGMGLGFLNGENWHDALKYYLKGLEYIDKCQYEVSSLSYSIYKNIGLIYYHLQEYHKSRNYYNKALEIDASDILLKFFLAYTQFKLEDYIEAEKNYLYLLDRNFPGDKLVVCYKLIKIYTKMNKDDEAFTYLKKATEIELEFYRLYSWSDEDDLINTKVKYDYLDYMQEKLSENKNKLELIGVIIYTLFKLNKDRETNKYIDLLTDIYENHEDTYYWRIILALRKENNANARELYKEIKRIYPDFFYNYNWAEVSKNKDSVKEILCS